MDLVVQPVVELYRTLLTPIAPFTWFGLPLSTLDLAATARLCVIMRQLRDAARVEHARKIVAARRAIKGKDKAREAGIDADEEDIAVVGPRYPGAIEEHSFVRHAAGTLLVVYGGEMVTSTYPTILCVCTPTLMIAQRRSSGSHRRSCSRRLRSSSSRSCRRASNGCRPCPR
jgi:hypothetical protein